MADWDRSRSGQESTVAGKGQRTLRLERARFPVLVVCPGLEQTPARRFSTSVTTSGVIRVNFTARSTHCSDIQIDFFVDGELKERSDFLAAEMSTGDCDLGLAAAGTHTLELQATGRVGGCNSGALWSWGGTLEVTTSVEHIAGQAFVRSR